MGVKGAIHFTNMEDAQSSAEFICVVCGEGCTSGFDVWSKERKDGTFLIAVDSTPDRDFNVCDLCNDTVHFRCSKAPETGLCDKCLAKVEKGSGKSESAQR
jgi:hypothetical protein